MSSLWYHHYLFAAAETRNGQTTWRFRPFTGCEPKPKVPQQAYTDPNVTTEQFKELDREYAAATREWATARFRRDVVPLIRAAAPARLECSRARSAVDTLYASLLETSDNRQARLLQLVEAHARALETAAAWDDTAATLAAMEWDYWTLADNREVRLRDVADAQGMDIARWEIPGYDDSGAYWETGSGGSVTSAVQAEISKQENALRKAADSPASLVNQPPPGLQRKPSPVPASPEETTTMTYYENGSLSALPGPEGTVTFRMEGADPATGESVTTETTTPESKALSFAAKILQTCGKREMHLTGDGDHWATS